MCAWAATSVPLRVSCRLCYVVRAHATFGLDLDEVLQLEFNGFRCVRSGAHDPK